MLSFPDMFSEDEKADRICMEFVNNNLIAMLKDIRENFEEEFLPEEQTEDNFDAYLSGFFPEKFDGDRVDLYEGLIGILEDQGMHTPNLLMEYLLAHAIDAKIMRMQLEGNGSTKILLPKKERAYVRKVFRQECLAYVEDDPTTSYDDYFNMCMDQVEDVEQYLESCFWDFDFQLLDEMSIEELEHSPLNDMLGIGLEEGNTFFLDLDSDE